MLKLSADVSRPGWRVRSSDIVLKGHHLRTIPSEFGLIRPAVSEVKILKTFFPYGPMLKLCRLMSAALVGGLGHKTQF